MDRAEVWHRLPGEPGLWHGRFRAYLMRDPSRRSIRQVWLEDQRQRGKPEERIAHRRTPAYWLRAARQWRWQERAAAWDEQLRLEDAQIWEARRREERDRRYELLRHTRATLNLFLEALDPQIHEIRPAALMRAAVLLNRESRAEFGAMEPPRIAPSEPAFTWDRLVELASHLPEHEDQAARASTR